MFIVDDKCKNGFIYVFEFYTLTFHQYTFLPEKCKMKKCTNKSTFFS